jgi:2-polyprenyl-6-methoxyphenol hydroxylase-like FAD-dependent oxidoreductase
MDTEVLVVGAGPVGLLLAAELRLAGVRPTVIDRLARPSREQKARGIGSLASEALRRRGLGAQLAVHHERGSADFRAAHGSDKGHFAWIHKIDLVPADEPERMYTFIWQRELEEPLGRWLAELGVSVLREHELTALHQGPNSSPPHCTPRPGTAGSPRATWSAATEAALWCASWPASSSRAPSRS